MTDYEPHYRYWVGKKLDVGWTCERKTNWRWVAYWHARRMSRRGYRYKVEDHGRKATR